MDQRRKASISSRNLIDAVLRVERMSFTERERLGDEAGERTDSRSLRRRLRSFLSSWRTAHYPASELG